MRLVVIESPFAGDVARNLRYLRACMRDCLIRGEAPFASHALYTQPGVLDDSSPEHRKLGMGAGFAWRPFADAIVVYIDLGITPGMAAGIADAVRCGHGSRIVHRSLGDDWEAKAETDEQTFKTRWP